MPTEQLHPTVQRWLDLLTQQGRSQHTLAAYQRAFTHLAQWSQMTYSETFDPTQLIGRDIRDWKSYQQSVEKAAPSTVNQRLVGVSSYYKWALAQSLVVHDPTINTKTIRLTKRQPKSLSSAELRRLLRAVYHGGSVRDVAIIEVLAGTGLRVGELLQLQVGDLTMRERSGWVTVREGKHGGYREVPLATAVRTALTNYMTAPPDEQPDYFQRQESPLWVGKHGVLTHRSAISRLLDKYAARAKLETITPHALRHTFATLYLKANPDDLRGLAALLGHNDLNSVMIYTEPTREDIIKRLERMEL